MGFRINGDAGRATQDFAGQRVKPSQRIDFIIEQFDANGILFRLGRKDIDDIAPHPETAPPQLDVVTGVLHARQTFQNIALRDDIAQTQLQNHLQIQVRITQTVNRRDGRDQHHVIAFHQRFGGGQPQLLNLFVHRGVFGDVSIGSRYIGFG